MSLIYAFKLVSEDLISGINIYAFHTSNAELSDSLRAFTGSQEIVTGLIDFLSGMFLLYLYCVMGQIEMVAKGKTDLKPTLGTTINRDRSMTGML